MPKNPQCVEDGCSADALNARLTLARGGSAKCNYCGKHAVDHGFNVPKAEAAKPAAAPKS